MPIQIKRRSGRKLVTLPGGEAAEPRPWDVAATPMQLALARGYRWLAMLESGEAKSITELAVPGRRSTTATCAAMLNLTTLAPDIVAAILDETLPHYVTVHELAISPPVVWEEQRARIGVGGGEKRPE